VSPELLLDESNKRMRRARSLDEFIDEYSNFCDIRAKRVTSPEIQIGIPLIGVVSDYGQGSIEAIPPIIGEISSQLPKSRR